MLAVSSSTRVYLYMQPVDMRRSYDGLHAIVQGEFRCDIRLGDYFMFINRRRDRIKIIWWDRDGLAIFMKRLESGTVQKPHLPSGRKEFDHRSSATFDADHRHRCLQHQASQTL